MSEVVTLSKRRTGRVAPPSLRPAALSAPDVAMLTRLLDQLPARPENDR